MLFIKNINFNDHLTQDLAADAQFIIQDYALKKYSWLSDNNYSNKGLWNEKYGLYISPLRAHERAHVVIAEDVFGKKAIKEWHGVTLFFSIEKNSTRRLYIHADSATSAIGTLPGIPIEMEETFTSNMIELFKNIKDLNFIRISINKKFYEYSLLTGQSKSISKAEFHS